MPCERKHIEAIRDAFFGLRIDEASRLVESGTGRLAVAIHAALAACDESPWRSMDSAPKDDEVLVVEENGRRYAAQWKYPGQWYGGHMWLNPIGWAHLPAAPEVKP